MHEHRAIKKRRRIAPWAVAAIALALVAFTAVGAWWLSSDLRAHAGTPRLVVDRDTVDLGNMPFETPAHVAFTLTNRGDAALVIDGVPRVDAVQGC
jgi:hypothetical protein